MPGKFQDVRKIPEKNSRKITGQRVNNNLKKISTFEKFQFIN